MRRLIFGVRTSDEREHQQRDHSAAESAVRSG
jgi:hypothetical protein